MAINTQKVVVGGLSAGVVLAVLDFLVNGVLMRDANTEAMAALNPALVENAESAGMVVAFIVLDLLFGILLVWTYAAMRPRFGAGPGTAIKAAVQLWLVGMIMYTGMTLMGMWTWWYLVVGGILFLVMLIISALVGGRLYAEE